ncbi:MAG TPA: hypothetical protein VLE95_02295 [Chlamydiales bacterium]|nr:hypothetical protein [Chlamydiales bacterium]
MTSPIRDRQSSQQSSSSQPIPSKPTADDIYFERIFCLSQQLDSMHLPSEKARFKELDGVGRSKYLKDRTQLLLDDVNDRADKELDENRTQHLKALQSAVKLIQKGLAEEQKKLQEEKNRDWCPIL